MKGGIHYGDYNILPAFNTAESGDGNLTVSGNTLIGGDAIIYGNLKVNGVINGETDIVQRLIEENKALKQRLEKLECIVNEIWFSPNMPGYEIAKQEWAERLETDQKEHPSST